MLAQGLFSSLSRCWQKACSVVLQCRCLVSPKAKTWERKRDGMNTLRNSVEKIPPFLIAPLFFMLKETECLGCLKWNSLGGMFSGLLDQLDSQSTLFFRASTSSSPSATSSPDWELWFLLVCISTSNMICPSSVGKGCHSESCLLNCSVQVLAVHPKESSPRPHWGGYALQPPVLPIAVITAIAAVPGELHPGAVEAGGRWQRLFAFLTVVVAVVRGRRLIYQVRRHHQAAGRAAAPQQGPSAVLQQQHNQHFYFHGGKTGQFLASLSLEC